MPHPRRKRAILRQARSLATRPLLWAIQRAGYDLIRPDPDPRGFKASHLTTVASPRTVFDVGVASGTPALYEAFPNARFVLVEPLTTFAPVIEELQEAYDCLVVLKAAGSEPGCAVFNVDLQDPEKSSFETRSSLTARGHETAEQTVEVTTLDHILRENPSLEDPILIKLDTEGHELDVLRGATELLERADTVISEVSVARRFEGGYAFEDMILFMKDHGFRLVDILTISHAKGELEPHHMDVVFKKSASDAG